IGQDHGEGLVADQRTTTEDGVAQAFHLDLAGVGKGALVDQAADADQVLLLVGAPNLVFQLVADVEMVLQGALAATGDHGDLGQPGLECLLDAILDQRLVDDRQHLLGHGLGGRQKASAVTGSREQTFLDHDNPWDTARSELPGSLNRHLRAYNGYLMASASRTKNPAEAGFLA